MAYVSTSCAVHVTIFSPTKVSVGKKFCGRLCTISSPLPTSTKLSMPLRPNQQQTVSLLLGSASVGGERTGKDSSGQVVCE